MTNNVFGKYLIILGVVMMLFAIGNISSANTVWASNGNQGCVPGTVPCPTPTPAPATPTSTPVPPSTPGGNPSPTSDIRGTVTDLSTGNPGAGITVQINQITVTTDSNGGYSLANVSAGAYVITLVLPEGAIAAQDPVTVQVDGVTDVTVDLAFYSSPQPTLYDGVITGTTAITTTGAPIMPTILPETGSARGGMWWFAAAGLFSIIAGIWLQVKHKASKIG